MSVGQLGRQAISFLREGQVLYLGAGKQELQKWKGPPLLFPSSRQEIRGILKVK